MELKNGQIWKDTEGNTLHAHGGHMLLAADGYYYWYGEDKTIENVALDFASTYDFYVDNNGYVIGVVLAVVVDADTVGGG